MIVGYTQGTFDTLHYGHVRLLKNAKMRCDYLIVGVNSDRLVKEYKCTNTVIKEKERLEIIQSIRYVDEARIVDSLDKIKRLEDFRFDIVFIGDDWKGSERWNETEKQLGRLGIKVVYLKHTEGISSTIVKEHLKNEK